MSADKTAVEAEIRYWSDKVRENDSFLEIAFFKIFVKYENFIFKAIVEGASSTSVNNRISFENSEHLKKTVDIKYLDWNKAKKLADQIFTDNHPIQRVFLNDDDVFMDQMRLLRNYIAHGSDESKIAYNKHVLSQLPNSLRKDEEFLEPDEYLKLKKANEKDSKYTKFINIVIRNVRVIEPDM